MTNYKECNLNALIKYFKQNIVNTSCGLSDSDEQFVDKSSWELDCSSAFGCDVSLWASGHFPIKYIFF